MTDHTMTDNNPRRNLATLLVFGLVGVIQFAFLTRHSLWNNEFITLNAIKLDYGQLIAERLRNNHVPGYFLAIKAWTSFFGTGEFALHFPSAVVTMAGIVMVWRLGRHLYGPREGLLTLALAGLCQIHVQLGSDARMYGWLFCAAALALWAFVRYVDEGGGRHLAFLFGAGLFGLAVQLVYVFLPLALLAWWLAARRRQKADPTAAGRWRRGLLAAFAPFLFLAPLIVWWATVENKVGHSPWRSPEMMGALRQVIPIFMGEHDYVNGRSDLDITKYFNVALVLLCFVLTLVRRRGDAPTGASRPDRHDGLLWTVCLLPAILIGLASMKSDKQFENSWRYYVTGAAAAPLLLTSAHQRLRDAWRRPRLAALWAVLTVGVMAVNTAGFIIAPGPGLREAAAYIATHKQPGDIFVSARKKSRNAAFIYYGALDREPIERPPAIESAPQIQAWLRQVCAGGRRLWVIYYEGPDKGFARAIRQSPETFISEGKVHKVGDTTVEVYRIADAKP
ncbi:MAG: glycosyltransferase family 39 protein [bacterium]|nr:glycosyltransferase family 39 protein [bacterium]